MNDLTTILQGLSTAAFTLLAAAVCMQLFSLFRERCALHAATRVANGAAGILLLLAFCLRSVEISYVALTGAYEALLFFSALICLLSFFISEKRFPAAFRELLLLTTFLAVVFLALASSPLTAKEALAPVPALRSAWLLLHVSFAFIGEAFFVLSFAAALTALLSRDEKKRAACEGWVYKAVAAGYPFFTAGALIFGAVWAQTAWGRWWGWDPKEAWALVTWLIYTAYLHLRFASRLSGKTASLVAIFGFLCTVFTLLGVNLLFSGLHSYL